jgi:hypothetical protein
MMRRVFYNWPSREEMFLHFKSVAVVGFEPLALRMRGRVFYLCANHCGYIKREGFCLSIT